MLRALSRLAIAPLFATVLAGQVAPTAPRGAPILAQTDPLHQAGRNVTVSLLTMGNGEEVWELFGHTAIWIHDNSTGRDTVFNWGVFDSHKPLFIPHFLQGLMLYQMGGETMDQLLYQYRYFNRSVVSQELDLTAPQKDSLLHLIQDNARPENLEYRYDYFQDNCSTRPRDLIDQVLGGQLHAKATGLSGTSYRWQAVRLMQSNKPLVVGVDIGLGEPSDVEITTWQTMFLPKLLHDFVGTAQVRDGVGGTHPLVRGERVLFQSTRGPEPAAPPKFVPWLLPVGLVVAGLFIWLGVRARAKGATRGARIVAAIVIALWCAAVGLLGTVLTVLWTVTDHVFAHANENLLLFNPFWLVLAGLVAGSFSRGGTSVVTHRAAIALAGLGVVALVAHVLPLSHQANLAIIALALPPSLAIVWLTNPKRFRNAGDEHREIVKPMDYGNRVIGA